MKFGDEHKARKNPELERPNTSSQSESNFIRSCKHHDDVVDLCIRSGPHRRIQRSYAGNVETTTLISIGDPAFDAACDCFADTQSVAEPDSDDDDYNTVGYNRPNVWICKFCSGLKIPHSYLDNANSFAEWSLRIGDHILRCHTK